MVHLDQAEKLNYSKDGNSTFADIPSRIAAEKLKNREKNAKMPHIIDIVA